MGIGTGRKITGLPQPNNRKTVYGRFFIWDAEGTFESGDLSRTGFTDFPSWAGGNKGLNGLQEPISQIYRALRDNPAFGQTFGDRLYKHFYNGGALTETNITKRFMELRNEMLGVLPYMNMYILNGWVPNLALISSLVFVSEKACIPLRVRSSASMALIVMEATCHRAIF